VAIELAENTYGKSRVRLVQVKRGAEQHDFREWTLEIRLRGDFAACFTDGDNSRILPTDTMKNAVYSQARKSSASCMEEFGLELAEFFLERNSQVAEARVAIAEKAWEHLIIGGKPQPTTFVQASVERQTAEVARRRNADVEISSGLENLTILKTAGSEFVGFLKDSLTTLPEMKDRLLGTSLRASWKYKSEGVSFVSTRKMVRETVLRVFAQHGSKSVQHTLYAMGEAALEAAPEMEEIELAMPNIHCLPVDLSRFGQDNPNEIFVPIDEPHGSIEARLRRRD
jgi:urate oxidase